MTTAREPDQHPATPVVHLSRRAALEAERAAARRPARRVRPVATAPETTAPETAAPASTAPVTTAPATTAPVERPVPRIVRRPAAVVTSVPRAPRSHRASRITLTSAIAALAMFAASAMPAHASAGTSMATSTLAPTVRTQDYAVTRAISASDLDRDGFTIGGGTAGAPGTAVSYGGEVRSPFPGPVRMSSGFGYRSAPCGACSSLHQGLDFNPGMGAPIGAVAAGTVRVSGTYFSYGTAVIIDHEIDGRRVSTLYGHMIPGSSPLRVGDRVEAGEFIGKVGSSGVSTGAHLHLEVLMDGVTPIDPEAWLEARIGRSLTT